MFGVLQSRWLVLCYLLRAAVCYKRIRYPLVLACSVSAIADIFRLSFVVLFLALRVEGCCMHAC
jgi:hypothetical protein